MNYYKSSINPFCQNAIESTEGYGRKLSINNFVNHSSAIQSRKHTDGLSHFSEVSKTKHFPSKAESIQTEETGSNGIEEGALVFPLNFHSDVFNSKTENDNQPLKQKKKEPFIKPSISVNELKEIDMVLNGSEFIYGSADEASDYRSLKIETTQSILQKNTSQMEPTLSEKSISLHNKSTINSNHSDSLSKKSIFICEQSLDNGNSITYTDQQKISGYSKVILICSK